MRSAPCTHAFIYESVFARSWSFGKYFQSCAGGPNKNELSMMWRRRLLPSTRPPFFPVCLPALYSRCFSGYFTPLRGGGVLVVCEGGGLGEGGAATPPGFDM